MTSFIYRFDELITNYNDVADTTEIIEEDEMKELLRKAILGHPDLLSVEISDKAYERNHGRKMDYQNYHEHIEDICQSLDISRQENKITSNHVSEVHEQEESCSINKHDVSDDFEDQDDKVGGTEDQDTDSDYKVNKTSQKKFIPYKPKSKAAMVTLLPSNMYSSLSPEDKQVWSKLSPEGCATIIKRINKVAKPTDTTKTRISSHHERVEVQVHEGNPSDGTTELEVNISEREFSPGQLELQRRVALAQSKQEVKQHVIDDKVESTREVQMAKLSYRDNSKHWFYLLTGTRLGLQGTSHSHFKARSTAVRKKSRTNPSTPGTLVNVHGNVLWTSNHTHAYDTAIQDMSWISE